MSAREEEFITLISMIASKLDGRKLDAELASYLNEAFPTNGAEYKQLASLCVAGEEQGWLLGREAGSIKFCRAIKPNTQAGAFSVDVVRMKDVKGPHHIHTEGEIGAIIPIDGDPKFDGLGAGWYVYPAGSDHHPTVSGGDAYVLYLLPNGAIEFTGK